VAVIMCASPGSLCVLSATDRSRCPEELRGNRRPTVVAAFAALEADRRGLGSVAVSRNACSAVAGT